MYIQVEKYDTSFLQNIGTYEEGRMSLKFYRFMCWVYSFDYSVIQNIEDDNFATSTNILYELTKK